MPDLTINIDLSLNGSAANASSTPLLSNDAGTFGAKRLDTGAVVVADGAAFTPGATGQYSYVIPNVVVGVVYEYWIEIVTGGTTQNIKKLRRILHSDGGGGIEPAFRSVLLTNGAVGAVVVDRVYIENSPQDERRSRVVIHNIDEIDPHTLTNHAGYCPGRMQVNCFAPSAKQARALAALVRSALDGQTGTIAGCEVDWIKADASQSIPQEPLEGKGTPVYGVAVDFTFMYRP